MSGNILKDTKYREYIEVATAKLIKPWHPRHHGVVMQAHHAISAQGVKLAGPEVGKKLVESGYDINHLPNLVFIPSTLQGACHLGVQPHRGDHRAPIAGGAIDDDDDRLEAYHDMIAKKVLILVRTLAGKCPASDPGHSAKVKKAMNELSEEVVDDIQSAPASAPLTKIAKHFAPRNRVGCGGVDSVPLHDAKGCPVDRDHEHQQGPNQQSEQITHKKSKPYVLKVER